MVLLAFNRLTGLCLTSYFGYYICRNVSFFLLKNVVAFLLMYNIPCTLTFSWLLFGDAMIPLKPVLLLLDRLLFVCLFTFLILRSS